MNPADTPKQPSQALHPMVVLQPGERVICDIKRHPFGIISMYVAAAFGLIVVAVSAFLSPNLFSQYSSTNSENIVTFVQAGAVIFGVLIILVLFVATVVYWQNRWIVTDDSITQINQNSLFGRKVSQLSMENLEDITIEQEGFLQTMFNFGTLRAETAGERSKFIFQYCPDPKRYARAILEVHETFIHQIRHQPQAVNPVMPINGPYYSQSMQPQPYPQMPTSPAQPDGVVQAQQPGEPYLSTSGTPSSSVASDQSQQFVPQWGTPVPPAPYQPQNDNQAANSQNRTTLPPPLQ